jgi:hypothetical protein
MCKKKCVFFFSLKNLKKCSKKILVVCRALCRVDIYWFKSSNNSKKYNISLFLIIDLTKKALAICFTQKRSMPKV